MPEINESELTVIENVLVKVREAIAEDESPEAMAVKQEIIDAEQIVSSKLEKTTVGDTGPTGGALMDDEEERRRKMMMEQYQAGAAGEMLMDDAKAMMAHMQEAMAIMQKAMPMMNKEEPMM